MSKLSKYVFSAILVSGVLVCVWAAASVWFEAEEAAELSCLGSVHTAATKTLASRSYIPTADTRELSRDEIAELFADNKSLDCYRRQRLLDELHISIGAVNNHYDSPVRVWSNGWDGKSGTNDDLIVPFQEMQSYRELKNR